MPETLSVKIFISCLPLRSKLLSSTGVKDSDDFLTKSSDTYGRAGQFKTEPALFLVVDTFYHPKNLKLELKVCFQAKLVFTVKLFTIQKREGV
jgi:hypothetical protein